MELDVGNAGDLGQNTFSVNGAGIFLRDNRAQPMTLALDAGNVFRLDGQRATAFAAAPATGVYGGKLSFSASLQAGGVPVAGEQIIFTRSDNTILGTAYTDANGIATLANISLVGQQAGNYIFHATYAGNSVNVGSTSDAVLSIEKANAIINVASISAVYDGLTHSVSGTAKGVESLPADLTGLLTIAPNSRVNVGSDAVAWTFAGNTNYKSASGTATLTVTQAQLFGGIGVTKIDILQDTLNLTAGIRVGCHHVGQQV